MDTDETNKSDYPQFIPNKPCGIDKYEGKSQEKLSKAIVKHIIDIDTKFPGDKKSNKDIKPSRIIGLEGGWGAGKSNVIKQLPIFFHEKLEESKDLENKDSKYYIFEFDAWGHQEDLQRRSFLEVLTIKLIKETILTGKTEISIFKGGKEEKKEVEWKEKLNYLLARKSELNTEKRPKFSISLVVFIIATVLTSITISIANTIKDDCPVLSILLPIIPFLVATFILFRHLRKKRENWNDVVSEILSIYSGKVEKEVTYETISEKEPSVEDFRKWMLDISKHLKMKDKKLIIVYDNMDRLPAEKVKELWSSIHTFFSEEGFSNIWTIIPFDEKHLSCAFGESDEKEKLTKYFISKTFPVVYRVTPPVITDFKEIFNAFFKEAFGETEVKRQDDINRIFRLEKPDATVRDIIEFINQLVALKNIWGKDIDILYMAIFLLKKEKLFDEQTNVVDQILSRNYLDEYIPKIVSNDENLQTNISALVYGVPLKMAEQIPMSKYIEDCFNPEHNSNINKYANSNSFISILKDKIKTADFVQTDNIVESLSKLDVTVLNNSDQKQITYLWDELGRRNWKFKLKKQEFNSTYKNLLLHTSIKARNEILKELCNKIQHFDKNKFSGKDYYSLLNEIKEFLERNKIDFDLLSTLEEIEVNANIFIDYVRTAKNEYQLFKLKTDPQELENYFVHLYADMNTWSIHNFEIEGKQDNTNYGHALIISVLSNLLTDKNYKFDAFLDKVKEYIPKTDGKNFKQYFDVYKLLSPNEKPLEIQLTATQRQSIWNAISSQKDIPEYLEIVTIQMANGANIGETFNEEQIKYIAENIDYYGNYGELLIKNIPALAPILKYMTENKLGYLLNLELVLPKFIEIKNRIGVTESVLLEQLNDCEKHKDSITAENIEKIIPNAQFFQFSKETNNALTDYLNTTIVKALSDVTSDILFQQRQQPNYYWNIVINNFIDTDYLKTLPGNLTELGKKYLDEIAASRIAVPNANDLVYKVIEKLDKEKVSADIKDIRDKYNTSQYNITPQLFLFFEDWFENQGKLKDVADRATHRIIEPVINDLSCLNKMTSKSDYYAKIINAAGNDATAVKDNIKGKLKNSTDPNLITFAQKIGIEKDKQEK